LAAAPCSTDAELRCDSAKASGTVTSYAIHFPLADGISVAPSGRLPSRLGRPVRFLAAGIIVFNAYVWLPAADGKILLVHVRRC